jgi:pimeloyl-ACP methyl ester carboxylesterase
MESNVRSALNPHLQSRQGSLLAGVLKRYPITFIVASLGAAAIMNRVLATRAEHQNPPAGRFITVNGVRLHYVERGSGAPLVLLHGNGSMIQDFQASGLLNLAAKKYRVIAFDRPGFGHSDRPRNRSWTPGAQADLLRVALMKIGAPEAIVLGHSWGALVAIALALRSPQTVNALVLVSGYYFPTGRADAVVFSAPALPVIGDVLSHTISPLLARLILPLLIRKMFSPRPVPQRFGQFPREMALRPSQLQAAGAEAALMVPAARAFQSDYHRIEVPTMIVAGADDRYIETTQSVRLQRRIPGSTLQLISGSGHMVHQTATEEIMSAIATAAANARPRAQLAPI